MRGLASILSWAAGVGDAPPEPGDVESDLLLALVRRHRLGTRLLYRLRERKRLPDWCHPELLTELHGRYLRAVMAQEQKIAAFREIVASLGDAPPPLPIKGWTTYALTGERRQIRRSGDLDLLCADPSTLRAVLGRLGYVGEVYAAGRHEYAHLRRGTVVVEIHRYFPVYSYPEGVLNCDRAVPGCTDSQAFPPPVRREVRYEDVLASHTRSDKAGTEGLLVPDPTMAAFLLCVHEFKEYLCSPLDLPVPVRLGVLADIRDLIGHPLFCPIRFASLTERFGAGDALSLIAHLLACWLDTTLPGVDADPRMPLHFPRQLGFRGAWANLYPAAEGITPPERAALLDRFFANAVEDELPPTIEHALHPRWADRMRAMRFSCVRTEQKVILSANLPPLPRDGSYYRVRIDWKGQGVEAHAIDLAAGDASIRLSIARDYFPPSDWTRGDLSLLVTVMVRSPGRDDFFDAEYVAVLPIRVHS